MEGYPLGEREVFTVLRAHGLAEEPDDMNVMDALDLVRKRAERIDDAASYGEDEEEQFEMVLCEVEDILLEAGVIAGSKHFEVMEEVSA